ncbi:MFS transporter [Sphingorhabdus sp.]|uniref:MFS transporter n=1 Tax=Sphingorhabdus sp. TaxID=1902408 RepID=UPI0040539715
MASLVSEDSFLIQRTDQKIAKEVPHSGIGAPLGDPTYRRIWSSSLLSNLGQQMQAVAAAWAMLQLTGEPDLVALVQTAAMLPVMLLAITAGALADMYDRRRVAMAALFLCLSGAAILAVVTAAGHISPTLILFGMFVTGTGIALYTPAWQASAAELVGVKALPAAIALFAMSSNAARTIGPAVGGFVIASVGLVAAFSINAVLYLPIIVALFLWKREARSPRLPPERLGQAMLVGLRYVRHSPPMRRVILRAFFTSAGGVAIYAMLPFVAKTTLGGGPRTYGFLLGGFGLGAVVFAALTNKLQNKFSPEIIVVVCSLVLAGALFVAAFSPIVVVTVLAMVAAGGAWMMSISTYNISIQLASPRWVSGRALAAFQAAVAGGMALGAALWGILADEYGIVISMVAAGSFLLATAFFGLFAGLRKPVAAEAGPSPSSDPLVQVALNGRSGPLVIEIEYCVRVSDAREFYQAMRDVRRSRERNGAFAATLMRDISNPEIWLEKFIFPTWNDYLRARDRPTAEDRIYRDRAVVFHSGDDQPNIRRYLERPTGSVLWREDIMDPGEALPVRVTLTALGSH